MKLGELILDLASIDNHQNLPQREMMDWKVKILTSSGEKFLLSVYCDEDKEEICIDIGDADE